MPRALLTLDAVGADFRSAESDGNGGFAFQDLNPGRYTLQAQRTGFATQAYGARNNPWNGTPLVLLAGQKMKGLLFKLAPNGVISGRVLNGEGEPLGSAGVAALRPVYKYGERQWLSQGTTRANDLDEFRLAGLAAGSYIVAASTGLTDASLLGAGGKSADDSPEMAYVLTYHLHHRRGGCHAGWCEDQRGNPDRGRSAPATNCPAWSWWRAWRKQTWRRPRFSSSPWISF